VDKVIRRWMRPLRTLKTRGFFEILHGGKRPGKAFSAASEAHEACDGRRMMTPDRKLGGFGISASLMPFGACPRRAVGNQGTQNFIFTPGNPEKEGKASRPTAISRRRQTRAFRNGPDAHCCPALVLEKHSCTLHLAVSTV
jgi:hypothetical protein